MPGACWSSFLPSRRAATLACFGFATNLSGALGAVSCGHDRAPDALTSAPLAARRPEADVTASVAPPGGSASAEVTSEPKAPPGPPRPAWVAPADGKRGITKDFVYDAKELADRSRAYTGRIFAHRVAYESTGSLPLVVFFHGLNRDLIPHRWMGGGNEGDVREIMSDLFDRGVIGPAILAGPGSVQKAAVSHGASFPAFDFDRFVELVMENLDPGLPIDTSRIVVLGHSGAGCSERGGIVSALRSKHPIHAVVSIDTCMPGALASALSSASASTNVLVTWQTATWDREFAHFKRTFLDGVAKRPAEPGVLRELDQLPNLPRSHDATVKQTFDKWLPRLVPPVGGASP